MPSACGTVSGRIVSATAACLRATILRRDRPDRVQHVPAADGTNVLYRGHGGPASLRSRGSQAAQPPAHVGDGAARRRSGELPDEQGGEHGTKASQESSGEARGKEARGEKGP